LGRCKQKQRGLRGLLCRWPSITEWEMHITAQSPPPSPNDLYCVEWDVKHYITISYHYICPVTVENWKLFFFFFFWITKI